MCNKYFSSIINDDANIDALDTYLASLAVPTVLDPLKHWNAMDPSTNPLAQFALNFLCTPGNAFIISYLLVSHKEL
jgi:hypothetical protein